MSDWKSGKLLENCVQIASAVLGCASKAIPLLRKKRVPAGREPSAKLLRYKRKRGDKRGLPSAAKKGSRSRGRYGNGAYL